MKQTVYLLTGAAGNLGSSISRELIAQGRNVRALVLKDDPAEERVPPEVEIVTGDLMDADSLEKFFSVHEETETIVIHCASIVTVSEEYDQDVYAVNVFGTRNIIEKCIEHKVKKLVYISSTSAIPELPNGQPITEVNEFRAEAVIGFYGKTKAIATQLVLDAVRKNDLDASIVFPTGICGPNDYAYGYATRFIIDCVNGKLPAGIAGSFNSVDVRDLAAGVIACCEKGRKGEGYIMSNSNVTIREMFKLISSLTETPEVKLILPIPVAKVLAVVAGIAAKITGKPAALTGFAIYNLARNNNFSSKKAELELGYTVRPFEQTITDAVEWLRAEHRIKPVHTPQEAPLYTPRHITA
ncbi:NAD-dependent epimerase/dehydratase family protein [Brucepastera parasyntrophica]|uniref:NAD-dependent epimerase/dehydratase family protein n=1 Tax=Brucepastera parasyntrophica TaxID=2880008 RepID=UPI00210E6F0A|nr:NAD-dependent epimerase/dehydratase family protein [Brucepastera parasyntrophica]ULQ60464.1 NAD-dependent epimerase/dehydratase family protein [Brucepastera parasyntrophica]